jgi:HD-GYP domain-containing protein (c-di-GMP phosphodiesterase class II)
MAMYMDYRSSADADGTICAEDVISAEGSKLLAKGTVLNQYYIYRLLKFNIKKIWVLKEINKGYDSSEKAAEDILNSTTSIIESILSGGGVPDEFKDMLFNIMYYSDPDNFASIVSYVNQIVGSDTYTYDHSLSVAWLSVKIGNLYGFEKERLKDLMQVGLLHDIGKSCVPTSVLNKPDKLSLYEYELVKRHPLLGYHALKPIVSDEIAEAVLYHHEKLNGTGYPFGITEEKIPIFAQIICVADVFEALVAKRPYKSKISPFAALKILRNMALANEVSYKIYDIFETNIMNSFIGTPHPDMPDNIVIGYDREKIEPIYLMDVNSPNEVKP